MRSAPLFGHAAMAIIEYNDTEYGIWAGIEGGSTRGKWIDRVPLTEINWKTVTDLHLAMKVRMRRSEALGLLACGRGLELVNTKDLEDELDLTQGANHALQSPLAE